MSEGKYFIVWDTAEDDSYSDVKITTPQGQFYLMIQDNQELALETLSKLIDCANAFSGRKPEECVVISKEKEAEIMQTLNKAESDMLAEVESLRLDTRIVVGKLQTKIAELKARNQELTESIDRIKRRRNERQNR